MRIMLSRVRLLSLTNQVLNLSRPIHGTRTYVSAELVSCPRSTPAAPSLSSMIPTIVAEKNMLQNISIEAPVRFNGKWQRFVGTGFPFYPLVRHDVIFSLNSGEENDTSPKEQTSNYITLTVEKLGKPNGFSSRFSDLRFSGIKIASLEIKCPIRTLTKFLLGDTIKKTVLNLSVSQEIHTSGDTSVSGMIGFENGMLFLKLQDPETELLTTLQPNQVILLQSLAQYLNTIECVNGTTNYWTS